MITVLYKNSIVHTASSFDDAHRFIIMLYKQYNFTLDYLSIVTGYFVYKIGELHTNEEIF